MDILMIIVGMMMMKMVSGHHVLRKHVMITMAITHRNIMEMMIDDGLLHTGQYFHSVKLSVITHGVKLSAVSNCPII